MTPGYRLLYHTDKADDVFDHVLEHLVVHANAALGTEGKRQTVLLMLDGEEKPAGGFYAWWYKPDFVLDLLAVGSRWRGHGFGRILMREAEALAAREGCSIIRVDTFDYQAPDFYRKLGYEQVSIVPGYLHGHDRIFFRKILKQEKSEAA